MEIQMIETEDLEKLLDVPDAFPKHQLYGLIIIVSYALLALHIHPLKINKNLLLVFLFCFVYSQLGGHRKLKCPQPLVIDRFIMEIVFLR